jgi:hypothetical protein
MFVSIQRSAILTTAALTTLWLLLLMGCSSQQKKVDTKGLSISASLPLGVYVKDGAKHSSTNNTQFYFPQLYIYDKSERLVYSSHDNLDNVDLLKNKSSALQRLQPITGGEDFADIVEEINEFRARKRELLGQRRFSVLSIFLEDCHACSVQEEALSGSENRLVEDGINVLVLHLTKPHNAPNPAK